jgi:hypothetical protein
MSFRQSEGKSDEKSHDLEQANKEIPQSLKSSFRNDTLTR